MQREEKIKLLWQKIFNLRVKINLFKDEKYISLANLADRALRVSKTQESNNLIVYIQVNRDIIVSYKVDAQTYKQSYIQLIELVHALLYNIYKENNFQLLNKAIVSPDGKYHNFFTFEDQQSLETIIQQFRRLHTKSSA